MYALAPTIGAGLIITCAVPKTIVGQLLGSRVCVGVGLLSYSAYLWHQPLLAFARHRSLAELNDVVRIGLIMLTFGLAYLTWRYIETPFRQKTIVPKRWLWRFALASTVIIASLAVSLQPSPHEFQSALRSEMEQLYRVRSCMFKEDQTFETLIQNRCHVVSASPVQADLDSPYPARTYVLYGDSVAAHLYPGLITVATRDNIMQLTGGSCPAVRSTRSIRCADFYDWFVDEFVPKSNADAIIVSSRWLQVYDKIGEKEFRTRLSNLFEKLKGNRVIVHSQPVQLAVDVNRYVYKLEKFAMEVPNRLEVDMRSLDAVDSVLREESSRFGFEFIDLSQLFCSEAKCAVAKDGAFYFWDTIHLTLAGSIRVAEVTSTLLARMYDEQLYGKQAQLKAYSALSNNAIIVRNLDGTIQYWSKGAEKLYGWKPQDVQGLTSHQLLETAFPVPIEVINEELHQKGHWDGQLFHKRRDGSKIAVASHWVIQQNPHLKDRQALLVETNNFPAL